MQLLLIALRKLWPYLLGAAAILGATWWVYHHGYESGYAASEAKWQARFDAAEHALTAANEKARQTEQSSRALTDQIEKQHAETIASLNLRAADAERRYASLLRKYSAGSGSDAVRQDGGAPGNTDAAGPSSELIDRTGRDLAALARRCESDAAALTDLQEWIRGQRAIVNQ